MTTRRQGFVWLLALMLAPSGAFAQAPPGPAPATSPKQTIVKVGEQVWITTTSGTESSGRVIADTGATLTLDAGGLQTSTRWTDIAKIDGRDSVKNGAIIGAVAGGASMGIFTGLLVHAFGTCGEAGGDCSSDILRAMLISSAAAGGGALLGAGIDRTIDGRRTIYQRTMSVVPVVGADRRGVALLVTW